MFDDHLVVESPGNLPSQVKINKIRNSHFARNSHIAEYLKDYKYVKDFGEGVDRMCREMEAQGLPKPEYKQDSFILKAIIRNSGYVLKKADFASEKVDFNPKKSDFSPKKVDFDSQKLNFEKMVDASTYNITMKRHMKAMITEVGVQQVFGAKYVANSLKVSKTAAIGIIKKMFSLGVIKPVQGNGKGKYMLNQETSKDQNG